MEEDYEQIPHFQNEGDLLRNCKMRAVERNLRFPQVVDIMPQILEEDMDEDDVRSPDEADLENTTEEEDVHSAQFQNGGDSLSYLAMRAVKRNLRFAQVVDIMPQILEEDMDEGDVRSQDGADLENTTEEEDVYPAQFQNGGDSLSYLAMRAVKRNLRFAQVVDIMPQILEEDMDEDHVRSPDKADLENTTEEEDVHPAQFQNGGDSLSYLATSAVKRNLRFAQVVDIMPQILEEDMDEGDVRSQDEADLVNTKEGENVHPAQFQNKGHLLRTMEMEYERAFYFQNELDSAMFNIERLISIFTK
jgi:nitrate reductase assembly molybdenum cofactor insertion protein NarJ